LTEKREQIRPILRRQHDRSDDVSYGDLRLKHGHIRAKTKDSLIDRSLRARDLSRSGCEGI
jgi:hypothetical protein